jgi:hypothetical protein
LDVHQASISVAVRDAAGKLIVESIIETKAATILAFIRGIQGSPSKKEPALLGCMTY